MKQFAPGHRAIGGETALSSILGSSGGPEAASALEWEEPGDSVQAIPAVQQRDLGRAE